MLERGYLTVGRLRGIPIRLHWTIPLGALLFSGFTFAPAFWIGFFLLVLIHELGHATVVRAYGHQVLKVDVTGFGGLCHWFGSASRMERGAIAWGGVLAQLGLYVATLLVLLLTGGAHARWSLELASVWTGTNLWIIGLNLLPFPPLDGAEAWRFVGDLFRGNPFPKSRFLTRRPRPPRMPKSPPSKPPSGNGASKSPPAGGAGSARDPGKSLKREDLADVLRDIGDAAGRARRPR